MNSLTIILSCLCMLYSIHSYPLDLASSSKFTNLPSNQIDHLCSYITHLQEQEIQDSMMTMKSESPGKRFVMPFPDMSRFLSTSHKLHQQENGKSGTQSNGKKHDFHAYLCSISKDSEEMINFINIFIEENGQPPAFNIFESCEQVAKRDQLDSNDDKSSLVQMNELSQFCSNQASTRFVKRGRHQVGGPISIDFINQMLESRKVQSYPYPAEMDPYLVGR